ncbi:hypothetical protein PS862_04122 [Pseudomonas fluorescens]|uniref:Uncharacterized protein n=1 Tax=Pseudomonas fluorescens TaxID=294 RepID=A0A5E6XZN8_PSEFL|nr:hypothetical protein [Pseudomonas fluorescens]VVN46998.1 hypothetical protein PS639_05842 [Pseudomonas fluorescens]VVP26281.1 hypothetical protein PS862_04122 [Pseudomonas fluorescens]
MPAKNVNDNGHCLNALSARTFFVGTPPGASSFLQGHKIQSPRTNISSSATSNTDNPISGPYGADCSHW